MSRVEQKKGVGRTRKRRVERNRRALERGPSDSKRRGEDFLLKEERRRRD